MTGFSGKKSTGQSTGPRSQASKARAARNALTHGLLIRSGRLSKSAFSLPSAPELMTRYQSALDNDLYKAMRALRDAQRFRRESIESTVEVVAEADSNAGTMKN